MDVKALLDNKKVLYGGVGVAGVAGLGVWYYRKSHGAGTTDTAATTDGGSTVPAGSAAGQFPDTSGTDVATWLGSQEGSFQDEFDQFLQQSLAQQQTFLGTLGTTLNPPPTTPPTTTPPAPTPPKTSPIGKIPSPKPAPVTHPYVTVERYTTESPPWESTLSGIAAHEHTTVAALEKLNGNVDPKKLQVGQHIVYK